MNQSYGPLLSPVGCVIISKSFALSGPQFPCLYTEWVGSSLRSSPSGILGYTAHHVKELLEERGSL